MRRYVYTLRALSVGAISLGILPAPEGLDFASLGASFVTQLRAALVAVVRGGLACQRA